MDRRVEVRLLLDISNFQRNAATASGGARGISESFDGLNTNLSGTNRRLGITEKRLQAVGDQARATGTRDLSVMGGGLVRLDKDSRRADQGINQLTGRIRLFMDLAAMVGPGLIGIGAVGVPALTGIVSVAGIAAAAVGSLVIASQGVGDALKALEKLRLDPTADNLERAQQALDQLGPDAAAFAVAFQKDVLPVFRGIRDQAAAGWFPGLTEELDELESLGSKVGDLMENVGRAGSHALVDGLESLDSERWEDFWSFLDAEAPATVSRLSKILGDLAHGAAEMWMEFDPGNDDFLDFITDAADGFDRWATSTEGRDDIRAFLDYTREVGPDVLDFFTATVNMLTQISEAASPLAGPVLESLAAIADVVAAIADSDLGTPIFTGLAALALYNRALSTTKTLQQTTWGAAYVGSLKQGTNALLTVTSAQDRARLSSANLAKAERDRAAAARAGVATIGKSAALIGGLAIASSGAADSIGLTNTASLGLMGTMGGPWGAAVGTAAGLVMDLVSANDNLSTSLANAESVLDSGAFNEFAAAIANSRAELDKLEDKKPPGWLTKAAPVAGVGIPVGIWNKVIGDQVDDGEEALKKLESQQMATEKSTAALGRALGLTVGTLDGSTRSANELEEVLQAVQPHLDELGITSEQIRLAWETKQGMAPPILRGFEGFDFDGIVSDLKDMQSAEDSLSGRTGAVADAVGDLGSSIISTEASANALQAALDQLLSPNLDLSAASDAWTQSLRSLDKELAKHNKTLEGDTPAAIKNREAIRGRITDLEQMLVAEAKAGAGPKRLAEILDNQTQSLLNAGDAAGISRPKLAEFLREMGLTPKLIRTTFEAAGINVVEQKARDLRGTYDKLPKNVRAEIRADGIPKTVGDVDRLVEKYHLTEKQRTALLRMRNLAQKDLEAVLRGLGLIEKPRTTKVDANVRAALAGIGAVQHARDNLQDKKITITTVLKSIGSRIGFDADGEGANGLTVPDDGGAYSDRFHALLAPKEEVVSDRYGGASKNRGELKAASRGAKLRVVGMADGGTAGGLLGGTYYPTQGQSGIGYMSDISRIASGMEVFADAWKDQIKAQIEALQKEQQARQGVLDGLKQERDSLAQTVEDRFKSQLFGFDQDPGQAPSGGRQMVDGVYSDQISDAVQNWLLLQQLKDDAQPSPQDALEGDIAEMARVQRLLKRLKKMGLDGQAFAEVAANANIDEILMLLAGGKSGVRDYERLFNQREKFAQQLGGFAGDASYGKAIREQTEELRGLKRELNGLRHDQKKGFDDVSDAAGVRGPKRFADAVNGAATAGHSRRH